MDFKPISQEYNAVKLPMENLNLESLPPLNTQKIGPKVRYRAAMAFNACACCTTQKLFISVKVRNCPESIGLVT